MGILKSIRRWAGRIKRDVITLWFAWRNPATPSLVKVLCAVVVAYALSPIDLIPDFIPILGLIDDALLLPGLIWLALRQVPADILGTSRRDGEAWIAQKRQKLRHYGGAVIVVAIWIGAGWAAWVYLIAPRL